MFCLNLNFGLWDDAVPVLAVSFAADGSLAGALADAEPAEAELFCLYLNFGLCDTVTEEASLSLAVDVLDGVVEGVPAAFCLYLNLGLCDAGVVVVVVAAAAETAVVVVVADAEDAAESSV